ncbi:MAG TPA: hypothetical protein VIH52_02225 [Candidatus Nanoarchaeia archaeon]
MRQPNNPGEYYWGQRVRKPFFLDSWWVILTGLVLLIAVVFLSVHIAGSESCIRTIDSSEQPLYDSDYTRDSNGCLHKK